VPNAMGKVVFDVTGDVRIKATSDGLKKEEHILHVK
jgi:hypothetical protein